MRTQGNGMISSSVPICHFCGMIGNIRPNCFNYIKRCRIERMNEKKLNHKAMHDPKKPRDLKILTTSNDIVEPRLIGNMNTHAIKLI